MNLASLDLNLLVSLDALLQQRSVTRAAAQMGLSQPALSQQIRDFAVTELGLPDNASYRRYADLHRSAVVWNVVAAPPDALTLKSWCFPVTGCVTYRGYFDEADAHSEAARQTAAGLETTVYGVPAYSTLGWLNLLGEREPEIYGRETLKDIERACKKEAKALGLAIDFRQSNRESDLIDWIQEARTKAAGLAINPAAFTHTSVAILDALLACPFPIVEVHLSNIHAREGFRHRSLISPVAQGVILGFGAASYELALDAVLSGRAATKLDIKN